MIPALVNHLWQSTLFAVVAGLLTLMVRKNGAAVRYGLWFAASVKFLIPFALLTAAGGLAVQQLHVSLPVPQSLQAIAPVIAPLAPSRLAILPAPATEAAKDMPALTPSPVVAAGRRPAAPLDPTSILLAVWALGLAVVLLIWARRWSHIRAALNAARPAKLPAPVPVLSTPFPMEPGVVGFRRPVVIVPDGIAEQLSPAEWQAVLAHELGHIRRRDNLTGLIHMLVQALFWFHPLVWWLGERLVTEREQACDEGVVSAGADAHTYAEGILKVCRLYVRRPLACVAGASGVNLKSRVARILAAPSASPLSPSKKALLLVAASVAFATPVAAGLLTPQTRQVAGPLARAMAAIAAPAHALGVAAAPAGGEAPKRVVLARNEAILGPNIAVAAIDAAAMSLSQTLSAPSVDEAPSQAAQPPAKAMSASVVSDPVQAISPKAIAIQARSFVQSHATAPNPEIGQIGRWHDPVCVQVQGLAQAPASEIKARIDSVAQAVGLPAARPGCRVNVEIVFSNNPQAAIDDVARRREDLLGYYHRSERDRLKTVNHPIQAWYKTSTRGESVRAGVVFSNVSQWLGPGSPDYDAGTATSDDPAAATPMGCAGAPRFTACLTSQFDNVLIMADAKALQGVNLGHAADYMVMLALSQPRSLEDCATLPSILDASACTGRSPPDGLTPADAAYLTALYASNAQAKGAGARSDIASRMAVMLIKATSTVGGG